MKLNDKIWVALIDETIVETPEGHLISPNKWFIEHEIEAWKPWFAEQGLIKNIDIKIKQVRIVE